MHSVGVKRQASDALSRLLIHGGDKIILNHAIPVLTIVQANNAKGGEVNIAKYHIVNEVLITMAPGLSAVFLMALPPTPCIQSTTAEFLAEKSKDLLCRKLGSAFRILRADYFYNRNVFLIFLDTINGAVQRAILQSLQARLQYACHYTRLVKEPTERRM